jgi:hypothetical protein
MDFEKMTKAQIIRSLNDKTILTTITDNFERISFGHIQMVENIGKALLTNPSRSFEKIINSALDESGNLVITIPKL